MSFIDTIKKSVLDGFSTQISVSDILMALLIAFVSGLFILLIYKLTLRGIAYNRGFELTLVLVCVISSMIVLTITSNLALSLGMVGALSIVRFRTALKDASDTAFMFWAVAAGITAGAHFYWITIIGCIFIGAVAFIAVKFTAFSARAYLLIVRTEDSQTADYVGRILSEKNIRHRLSSMTEGQDGAEIIFEVGFAGSPQKFVSAVKTLPGIKTVSLIDCRSTPS